MALEDEFRNYTNKQAYEAVFARRMMLREHPDDTRVLGNSQREDFLPFLHTVLKQLPTAAHILDVGGGAGDIVDLALARVEGATIHVEEPNEALLEKYRQRLLVHPSLKCGSLHPVPVERLPLPLSSGGSEIRCDAVLAIHMLYFVADLVDTLRALYGSLRAGGVLFVVIADQLMSTTGRAGRFHYARIGDESRVHELDERWALREELLGQAGIAPLLDPASPPTVEVHRTESWLFGREPDDVVAMCLAGELLSADDEMFDLRKLLSCRAFLDEHGDTVQFGVEDRPIPQKGWYRAIQPQIVTVIRRGA
ncbi:MAG TPA: class I SAM-dependent methyltransferase [Vicinamibacteria bacterium]|nr:class I SAM-dependent methyltransferase [Vicinamibacteria bacterium]